MTIWEVDIFQRQNVTVFHGKHQLTGRWLMTHEMHMITGTICAKHTLQQTCEFAVTVWYVTSFGVFISQSADNIAQG